MGSSFTVYWTKTAQLDLTSIIDYIESDNVDIALKIFQSIKNKAEGLNRFPLQGRIVPELKDYNIKIYREVIVSPWRIINRAEDKKVFVLAVLDSRRDLEDLLLDRFLS